MQRSIFEALAASGGSGSLKLPLQQRGSVRVSENLESGESSFKGDNSLLSYK